MAAVAAALSAALPSSQQCWCFLASPSHVAQPAGSPKPGWGEGMLRGCLSLALNSKDGVVVVCRCSAMSAATPHSPAAPHLLNQEMTGCSPMHENCNHTLFEPFVQDSVATAWTHAVGLTVHSCNKQEFITIITMKATAAAPTGVMFQTHQTTEKLHTNYRVDQ